MNCQRCDNPVSILAPLCPVCGADPVIGCDWIATSALRVDAQGQAVLSHGVDLGAASMFDLANALQYHATGIVTAEAEAVAVHDRWQQGWEALRAGEWGEGEEALEDAEQRQSDAMAAGYEEAYNLLLDCLPRFLEVAGAIRAALESGQTSVEEFESDHSPAVWTLREYGAYLRLAYEAQVEEVFKARIRILRSRRGDAEQELFEAIDGSFTLSYDWMALSPVSVEESGILGLLTDVYGGHEGSFGELALALLPAAWRGWLDEALAPRAYLLVFVRPDPLEGIACDDADWEGERAGACAHYGEWLGGPEHSGGDVRPATICGLPAVRHQSFAPYGDGTQILDDFAWVKGPRHLYSIFASVPEQRHELVRAVHGAFAGFAPAGAAAAREAGPASAGPADEPGPAPDDGSRNETGEEER